jgi:proton-coupled amino acid transporter
MNASVNAIVGGIGTVLLFMPYVFKELGIILSLIVYLLTGVICYYCWSVLGRIIRA